MRAHERRARRQRGRGQARRRGTARGGQHRRARGAAVGRGPACVAQLSAGRRRQDQSRRAGARRRRDAAPDPARHPRHRGCRYASPSRRGSRAMLPTTRPILAAHRDQLAALLERAGAASLDDAERLHVARREIEGKLRRRRRSSSLRRRRASSACSARMPSWRRRRQRSARRRQRRSDELETRANELMETLGAAEEKLNRGRARGAGGERGAGRLARAPRRPCRADRQAWWPS